MSSIEALTKAYKELSSLYKNPTRTLGGRAAANQDKELVEKHAQLFKLIDALNSTERQASLYVKSLGLLYEVDDYRGLTPAVTELIEAEAEALRPYFETAESGSPRPSQDINLDDAEVRSVWKAKVICCVGAIESKRKNKRAGDAQSLPAELRNLEAFVEKQLHRPQEGYRSWTTLAMVCAAQARLARQNQDYAHMRERLLLSVRYLDERAAELIHRLSELEAQPELTALDKVELEELADDLVLIRQKETLSISFNVGLAELQRGFLRSADYACQAAHLQFRLHGQFFHRLFNDLVLLSIRRARTPSNDFEAFVALENELVTNILRWSDPKSEISNPKLHLYALREMAVVQVFCGKTAAALKTLDEMERVQLAGVHWKARIFNLRARALHHESRLPTNEAKQRPLLNKALEHTETAFKSATLLKENIQTYRTAKTLLIDIQSSTQWNLIETIESLINYGTIQSSLGNTSEAIKSATVVVELCPADNPRLLAMGHLVLAEAHRLTKEFADAYEHLELAKDLERQVDHKYVGERMRAIEKLLPRYLYLKEGCGFGEAEDKLMGWLIERSRGSNVSQIATDINADRKTVRNYLVRLRPGSPYFHLKALLDKPVRGVAKAGKTTTEIKSRSKVRSAKIKRT